MNRGSRRKQIFLNDDHCILFLKILQEAVEWQGLEVHAYSLMPNHFHLLVRSAQGNLSSCMKHINGVYTQRINELQSWDGPVFRGRYKNQLVREESYLNYLLAYIHLNPIRAKLALEPTDDCWTSHAAYVGVSAAPSWLSRSFFLEQFGSPQDIQQFVLEIHKGSIPWPGALNLDTGWFAGAEEPPQQKDESEPADWTDQPGQVLDVVYQITGSNRDTILETKKGPGANPGRRFAVWALKRHTGLTYAGIGKLLKMSSTQVAKVVSRLRQNTPASPVREWILEWDEVWEAKSSDL